MDEPIEPPPPQLGNMWVREYAILDESVGFSAEPRVFIGGEPLGRVPCLAVGQHLKTGQALLLYCTREWEDIGGSLGTSIADEKAWAERKFPGVAARWVDTDYTEEEARKHRRDSWDGLQCILCERTPDQFQQLILKNDKPVCNECITQLHDAYLDVIDGTYDDATGDALRE